MDRTNQITRRRRELIAVIVAAEKELGQLAGDGYATVEGNIEDDLHRLFACARTFYATATRSEYSGHNGCVHRLLTQVANELRDLREQADAYAEQVNA